MKPDQKTPPEEFPFEFRFGIVDLICVVALAGVHMGLLQKLLEVRIAEESVEAQIGFFAFGIATALGPAYIAYRLATEKKIKSWPMRVLFLLAVDGFPIIAGMVIRLLLIKIMGLR